MKSTGPLSLLWLSLIFSPPLYADGLIYRLPEDGSSVEYELKIAFERNEERQEFEGTLSISSVGQETVDEQPCRWIEFKVDMRQGDRQRLIRSKVLIPESQFERGKTPISHVKKAWQKLGDGEVEEVTDFTRGNSGPLPAFLAGPFDDAKELDEEPVESGLGKLKCKGLTGSTKFEQSGRVHTYTFTNRLHDKAPFGVVASEVRIEITRDGEQVGSGSMQLMAKKVAMNAKSDISNGL